MFHTELEAAQNGFVLSVTYNTYYKRWVYRYLEELIVCRARLENYYAEGDTDTLQEEML